MALLYYVVSAIVVSILSATNAPDSFTISVAILLAGWSISSAISNKTKK